MMILFYYLSFFGETMLSIDEEGEIILSQSLDKDFHTSILLEDRFISSNLHIEDSDPNKITIEKLYEYTESLQDSVQIWFDIYNPFLSKLDDEEKIWLDKIQRIGTNIFHPLILSFFIKIKDKSERITLLKNIEKLAFLLGLVHYLPVNTISNYKIMLSLVLDKAHKIRNGDATSKEINSFLNDLFNNAKKENIKTITLKSFFKDKGFYNWKLIKYFLYEYNLSLQDVSKTSRAKIHWAEFNEDQKDFITVEHIYPQNPKKGQWQEFSSRTPTQKKILRNSLGNLLPLSRPKNASLSNKPLLQKVKGKEGSMTGYQFGCYAENEISHLTQWTSEEILERGIKLLTFMEKRWNIKVGTKEEKMEVLSLEFLRNS